MAEIDKVRGQEELQLRSRWSSGFIVGGGVLLLMDFLAVWFAYMSVRDDRTSGCGGQPFRA